MTLYRDEDTLLESNSGDIQLWVYHAYTTFSAAQARELAAALLRAAELKEEQPK